MNFKCTAMGIAVVLSVSVASPAEVEEARSAVKEWAATARAISREQTEWQAEKQILRDLVAIEQAKIAKLEEEIAATEVRLTTADEKRATLVEAKNEAADQAQVLRLFLVGIESDLRNLRPRLPEPLANELAALYQRVPTNPTETTLSICERMQTVMALIGGIRTFDEQITMTDAIRTVPGSEQEVSVRLMFLGLGQAYYLAGGEKGSNAQDND